MTEMHNKVNHRRYSDQRPLTTVDGVTIRHKGMTEHFNWLDTLCGPGALAGSGPALLLGLLMAGIAGSVVHCAPMCGPFVLGQVSDRLARIPAARLCESARLSSALLLPYHAGRLTTYTALGALGACAGAAPRSGGWLGVLPALLLLVAAMLFFGHALARLAPGLRPVLPVLDHAAPGWASLVRRLAGKVDRNRPGGGFLLGVALGFLPCGLLYAAIAAAAATGSAGGGSLAMLAFGLGTVPSLVAVGVAGQAAGRAWHRGVAVAAPVVLLANAVLLGAMAWQRFAAAA